jgi:hypothetical protein
MTDKPHAPFVLNDHTLVVTAPAFTLGDFAHRPEVVLRGHTAAAAARIYYRRYCHWIEPVPNAKPVLSNYREVGRRVPLNHDDELTFGHLVLRVSEPCTGAGSLLLEVAGGTGAIALEPGLEVGRVVLLRQRLRIASEPPCHVGLAEIHPDALAIVQDDRGQLTCESTKGISTLEVPGRSPPCWIQPVPIPGELVVRPLERGIPSSRSTVRLTFRSI